VLFVRLFDRRSGEDLSLHARFVLRCVTMLLALLLPIGPALAFDDPNRPDDAPAQESRESSHGSWKLSLGRSFLRNAPDGTDLNLRWRRDDWTAWVGGWHEPRLGAISMSNPPDQQASGQASAYQQGRIGFETAWHPFATLTALPISLQPSLQAASAGFVGGSLTLEVGEPWFGSIGLGRTHGRPYVNLNYDPNDAISVAVGHREEGGTTYYALLVADDRLGTGQRHLHLVGRWPLGSGRRFSVDLLAKRGTGEDAQGDPVQVRAGGLTLGWDERQWFARLAWDRRQNFGPADALRVSVGTRF